MINKRRANTAAIEALQEEAGQAIEIRQSKYLNNPIAQDHRTIKRIVQSMLGFKSFHSARVTLQGIEVMQRCSIQGIPWMEALNRCTVSNWYPLIPFPTWQ